MRCAITLDQGYGYCLEAESLSGATDLSLHAFGIASFDMRPRPSAKACGYRARCCKLLSADPGTRPRRSAPTRACWLPLHAQPRWPSGVHAIAMIGGGTLGHASWTPISPGIACPKLGLSSVEGVGVQFVCPGVLTSSIAPQAATRTSRRSGTSSPSSGWTRRAGRSRRSKSRPIWSTSFKTSASTTRTRTSSCLLLQRVVGMRAWHAVSSP